MAGYGFSTKKVIEITIFGTLLNVLSIYQSFQYAGRLACWESIHTETWCSNLVYCPVVIWGILYYKTAMLSVLFYTGNHTVIGSSVAQHNLLLFASQVDLFHKIHVALELHFHFYSSLISHCSQWQFQC